VVYPDGVWYRQATLKSLVNYPRAFIGNQVVQEYAFLTHRLPEPGAIANRNFKS